MVSPEGNQRSLILVINRSGERKGGCGTECRPRILGVDPAADNRKSSNCSCSQWKYVSYLRDVHR